MMRNQVTRRTVLGGMGAAAAAVVSGQTASAAEEASATPRPKNAVRQSLCQWCYNGKLSLEDLAREAARIGYRSIELVGPDVWPTLKKHGLTCAMGPGAESIAECLNRRENHPRCKESLLKNITLAAEAGVPSVICFSGNRKGLPDEEGIAICAEALKAVIGHAEKMKVNVCMELLNSKVDHKDYQFDHMAYGVELAKRVGSPRFGILYDIYHAQIMEGDVIRTIRENHQYILHYHTGGNPGRNEIDETQELNYTAIARAIAETGYKGFIGQEFIPLRDAVKSMEQAFRICEG